MKDKHIDTKASILNFMTYNSCCIYSDIYGKKAYDREY